MRNKTGRHRRHYFLSVLLAIFIAFVQSGCGNSSDFDQVSGQQGTGPGGGGGGGGGGVFAITAPGVVNNTVALDVGDTLQFSAGVAAQSVAGQLTLNQASAPVVAWTSSNPTAAKISDKGLLTAMASGQTDISATVNGRRSGNTIRVNVRGADVTLTSVKLTASPANTAGLAIGATVAFTATGTFSDGSTSNVTSTVLFNSSNTTVGAAPASNGQFTTLAAGSTNITATRDGKTSNVVVVSVAASAPTLTSINLDVDDNTLFVGDAATFIATGTFSDSHTEDLTSSVTFDSSVPSIGLPPNATGNFTALAPGSTSITATQGGKISNAVTVTVTVPPTLVSIDITPSHPSIEANGTIEFEAIGTFSDASTSNITNSVTWDSTDPTAGASPDSAGLFTALAAGSTDITASRDGVTSNTSTVTVTEAIVSITITSNPPPSPPSPPPAPPIFTLFLVAGDTATFTATATLADATTVDITNIANWVSSDATAGAPPDSGGLFTAGTAGFSTQIEAVRNGVTSNSITVTVVP